MVIDLLLGTKAPIELRYPGNHGALQVQDEPRFLVLADQGIQNEASRLHFPSLLTDEGKQVGQAYRVRKPKQPPDPTILMKHVPGVKGFIPRIDEPFERSNELWPGRVSARFFPGHVSNLAQKEMPSSPVVQAEVLKAFVKDSPPVLVELLLQTFIIPVQGKDVVGPFFPY